MTLRIKASILVGLIITLTYCICGYYYLQYLQGALKISILEGLDSVSQTSSREVSRFLSDSLREAQAIAQAIPKRAIEQKDAQSADNLLRSYFDIFPKFENGMFILDAQGSLWSDYPIHVEVRGRSFAFRQYYQKTMQLKKGIVGIPYRSARTGKPVLTFTAPLFDSAGRAAGLLGCSVQLTSPDALEGIRLTRIGQTGYVYVYDKDRMMILHPQADRILKRDVPVGANRLFDAAIEGFEGTGETVNSRGIPMLISLKHIDGSNWILGAQQPMKEAYAAIRSARIRIGWGIFVAAAISVVIGTLLMRSITNPLIRLQNAIRLLGDFKDKDSGLLNREFEEAIDGISGKGEIGDLKIAFKTMSERLDGAMRSLHSLAQDWENTFDSVLDVIFLLDDQNTIVRSNRTARALLEKSGDRLVGQPIMDVIDITAADISLLLTDDANRKDAFNLDIDGGRTFEIHCNALKDDRGNLIGKVLVGRDITLRLETSREKQRLEERLQRAQKMEAIGTLAGGVAHDLNNILSGIVSYPELLLMQLPKDSPLVNPLQTIFQSGKKATAIVQDLLTLARRGAEIFEVVNLNSIISEYLQSPEFRKLKSYHADVEEVVELAPDLLNIEGSSVHLSKVIMNLVSNAAEAMTIGGTIRIATQNIYVDAPIIGNEEIAEGEYVLLTITDDGQGIEPDDMDRIFEPFYTKKKMGHSGTGLGMSVVWGTVKDHHGFIDLKSAVGSGTTFKIYFPASRKAIEQDNHGTSLETLAGSNESILVVDDVETQRIVAGSILTQLGYSVYSVGSGEEAIDYLKDHHVDLLVLDMIMTPGMSGLETYRRAIEIRPDQKAIITSGYSETEFVRQAQSMGAGSYVKKPYTIENIGRAVKRELSQSPDD